MILVAGESLVDLLVRPDGDVAARLGGGPFNVARGLARLGAPTAFLGAMSIDAFGRRLRAALVADGVDVRWAPSTPRPTTIALAELTAAGPDYTFYTEGTAAPALEEASGVPLPAALHVGSLGLVLEPIATTLEALVERAAGRALVMVDPNWRPGAIDDPTAQRARLARVLRAADVVKVSTEDLDHMAPGVEAETAARALLAGRTRCVLVTDGPRPARALWRGGAVHADPRPVEVVDTVGAGDAFCSGFLAWWVLRGHGVADLDDAARLEGALCFAVDVAARTCGRSGADPPRLDDLPAPISREPQPRGRR